MATKVDAFTCDFCPRKKRFATASNANRHERQCFYNPIRKACATCAHYSYEKPYFESDTGYSDGGPYCELDKLNNEPGEQPLRSECEFWKAKIDRQSEGGK